MLNPTEKERLKNRADLKAKTRANLDYRIAKKIKTRLSELKELNAVLSSLPEKTAMKVFDDDMVAAIFELTENMIRILGFSAIELDSTGAGFVARSTPLKSKKGEKSFALTTKLATAEDMARQLLIDDHLAVLNHYMRDRPGMPSSKFPDSVVYRIEGSNIPLVIEAQHQMNKWGRPTLRTWDRQGL